jgi:hypothetical protein
VAQAVECLPSKHEALSLNPWTIKEKEARKGGREGGREERKEGRKAVKAYFRIWQ